MERKTFSGNFSSSFSSRTVEKEDSTLRIPTVFIPKQKGLKIIKGAQQQICAMTINHQFSRVSTSAISLFSKGFIFSHKIPTEAQEKKYIKSN